MIAALLALCCEILAAIFAPSLGGEGGGGEELSRSMTSGSCNWMSELGVSTVIVPHSCCELTIPGFL